MDAYVYAAMNEELLKQAGLLDTAHSLLTTPIPNTPRLLPASMGGAAPTGVFANMTQTPVASKPSMIGRVLPPSRLQAGNIAKTRQQYANPTRSYAVPEDQLRAAGMYKDAGIKDRLKQVAATAGLLGVTAGGTGSAAHNIRDIASMNSSVPARFGGSGSFEGVHAPLGLGHVTAESGSPWAVTLPATPGGVARAKQMESSIARAIDTSSRTRSAGSRIMLDNKIDEAVGKAVDSGGAPNNMNERLLGLVSGRPVDPALRMPVPDGLDYVNTPAPIYPRNSSLQNSLRTPRQTPIVLAR